MHYRHLTDTGFGALRINQLIKENMLSFKVIVHYQQNDPKFRYDYAAIDVFMNRNGEEIRVLKLEDHYHDKSEYQVKGFFHALDVLGIPYTRVDEKVADFECY